MSSRRCLSATVTGSSRIARRFQGRTDRDGQEEARTSLTQAIALILEDRREEGLRGVPPDAERETVTVG